jgi:hypothetical protein
MIDFLTRMSADYHARIMASSAMRNFLDGTGADRIARTMLLL